MATDLHTRDRVTELERQLCELREQKRRIPASWVAIVALTATLLTAVAMPVGHALIYTRFVSRSEYDSNWREIAAQLRATAELTSKTAVLLDAHISTPHKP